MTMISVIIPVYNDWHRLKTCLTALENQTLPQDKFEVIVVNNEEQNELPRIEIDHSGNVTVVHEPEPGSYAARNRGARQAVGEILAFTDSDCIPDADWLKSALLHFEGVDCELAGGKVEIFKPQGGSEVIFKYERETAFQQHRHVPNGHSVTANLFVKRRVFEDIGGFDSTMKSGGDWDFSKRCTESGYKLVYGENLVVSHPANRNLAELMRKQYRLACWGILNTKKRYGHSNIRIMISHLIHVPGKIFRSYSDKNNLNDRILYMGIEILRSVYVLAIHIGILLGGINAESVRE